MAEVADRTVSAERAALAETRRRIGATLDAIDGRVRPPSARVASGLEGLWHARSGLEVVAAAAATAARFRDVVRTVRSLSKAQQVLLVGGTVTLLGVLAWVMRATRPRGDGGAADAPSGITAGAR